MSFYRGVVDAVSDEIERKYFRCDGIRPLSLTKPRDLEARIGNTTFHRFTVAWGLSYPETDIGAVSRPNEIGDELPPDESASVPEIGKEVT